MKKMIGLLVLLCVGLWAIDADMADVIQQRTLETHSSTSIQGIVHGKPPVNPDASRDLLWDQAATQYAGFNACQWDSVYPFEAEICDNFELMADANIESLVWWGGYWGGTATPPVDFWIKIYPDSGGGNGPKQNPIYNQRVLYAETVIDPGLLYYYYEAVIPPFAATGGVTYWIEFEPTLVYPPQWGNNCEAGLWGDGQELYFKSAFFGYPDWIGATAGPFGVPDESSFQLYGSAGGPIVWDFETGWQDWTHTNGAAFPAAWDVQPSGLHSAITPPSAGDSSMWIDSDAISGTWVQDTALSPVLVPNAGMDWFKYGFGYWDVTSADFFEVGIKYFDGSVWTAAPLKTYTTDYAGTWDSVDVTGYAGYPQVQLYFYYDDANTWAWYAAFDNVSIDATIYSAEHDVGCSEVASPPAGVVSPGDYDVIGRIENFGNNLETFDATADVYDTTGGAWTQIFTATVTLTDFAIGGDSLVDFGMVTFADNSYFYTEIYTELAGDVDPSNDTSSVFSRTAVALGDVVFEMDCETPTGDNQLLGVEFDGTYFYVTGGGAGADPNKVYVFDTLGNLIWAMDQPAHSTGWGWRDLAWDYVYAGADRIDTLYTSVDGNVDKFGIDLATGTLNYYGPFPGPENPNRALAYDGLDWWFFTGNFSGPCYKFDKANPNIQSVADIYDKYGAAYDGDTVDGYYIWWHNQNDPGTGWLGMLTAMDPVSMNIVMDSIGYMPTITVPTVAGGLSFFEGFRGMDVLFALIQGAPDAIAGIFLRWHGVPGVEEQPYDDAVVFGFAPHMQNPINGHSVLSYTTTKPGRVSLKVYDGTGRLVETLVDRVEQVGTKNVNWDARNMANGVYFLRLEAEGEVATQKMILVK